MQNREITPIRFADSNTSEKASIILRILSSMTIRNAAAESDHVPIEYYKLASLLYTVK